MALPVAQIGQLLTFKPVYLIVEAGVEVQVVSADRDLETNPKKPWEEMGKLIAYRHNDDL